MAKYDVECPVCGDSYTINLVGPHKNREWRLENWDWTCDRCKEKTRQEENAKAAEANKDAGLPVLTGTVKMVAWAETIRKQKVATLDAEMASRNMTDEIDKNRFEVAVVNLKNKASARWWIEYRDVRVLELLRQEYQATETPLPPEEKKIADEAKTEALIEATVRPEKPITETIAEISVKGDTIEIVFPEKREDFRQIVRFNLGFTWVENRWQRTLKPTNGAPEDRVAEAGNKLLAAGFSIRIFDENLRVRAVYGHYEPESKRWVMARTINQFAGWFAILWPKGEDFYQAAKRLHGARYDKPSIVVPPEQFAEVLDFAEMYGFSISPGANKIIETAKEIRDKALTAKTQTKPDSRLPEPGGKPTLLDVPKNVDIDDEFKEGV